ncbi:MAG: sugar transferase [Marinosulfonomonas sp.]
MSVADQGGALTLEGSLPQPNAQTVQVPRTESNIALGGRLKRISDIVLASVALLAFSPLFIMVAYSVKRTSSGPLFYGHKRIGHGGKEFKCLKFRTMSVNGDAILRRHFDANPEALVEWQETHKLKNDPRVTRIGRVLRRYSVDELPQLINVIKGDMSVVGPRPVVTEELLRYGDAAQHYYAARPGITGLWQVSGRSDTSYETRVELDTAYVKNWTLAADCRIMLRTIPAVLGTSGSY